MQGFKSSAAAAASHPPCVYPARSQRASSWASVHSSPIAAALPDGPAAAWLAGSAVGCSPWCSKYSSADCTMGLPATQCTKDCRRSSVWWSVAAPLVPAAAGAAAAVAVATCPCSACPSALCRRSPAAPAASQAASGVQGAVPASCCAPLMWGSAAAVRRETSPPPCRAAGLHSCCRPLFPSPAGAWRHGGCAQPGALRAASTCASTAGGASGCAGGSAAATWGLQGRLRGCCSLAGNVQGRFVAHECQMQGS